MPKLRAPTATVGGRKVHPARTVFFGFAVAIAIGTGLLLVPGATATGNEATPIQALFTAVSAVCVTGLTIVDTATYWSGFGQVVILLLIQIGGFGVMTFASVVGIAVIRKLSLRSRITAAAEAKNFGIENIRALVLGIVKISLLIEGVVALILTIQFSTTYSKPFGEAVWLGVFHAVSSFNNAGFSLFSDNLMSYASDPIICLPICAAVILGGLGFPVLVQLRKHIRVPRLWSMNTRIVVLGTLVLLIAGTVFITALEWNNERTIGNFDWPARILTGFFQSVQTRTAGFNSVDIGEMETATWLGMDALMFIGGGSAGTAGGIKITTFAVLFFIMLAEIRGESVVNVLGKRLSRAVHRQAITVVLLAMGLVAASTLTLMMVTEYSLDALLFEVISAFGTVGLSTGIVEEMTPGSQLLFVLLMFIGRLGPTTFAAALALKEDQVHYQLPKERPLIG